MLFFLNSPLSGKSDEIKENIDQDTSGVDTMGDHPGGLLEGICLERGGT